MIQNLLLPNNAPFARKRDRSPNFCDAQANELALERGGVLAELAG
jgi:hypothetical protein